MRVPDESDRVASQTDAFVATGKIAAALKAIPAIDRDTLLLYAWGDLTYEGIAEALEVPIGTVRSRLNRARRTLRNDIGLPEFDDKEKNHGRVNTAPRNA